MNSSTHYDDPDEIRAHSETSPLVRNSIYNRKSLKKQTTSEQQNERQYLDQLLTAISDRRTKTQQNMAVMIILSVHALERFAFYGLVCNYVLYLNKRPLNWESFNASLVLLLLFGLTNLTSLLGGWIADTRIGKFYTIVISFVIYIIGYCVYPVVASSGNLFDSKYNLKYNN